ncbi:hypothetical protein N2W44_002905 [Clostridium perfringens]|uniref:Uncharacterized protein n=1 Tax=Clostridium perfringens TaxID=1502 RepID=A0A133NCC3_CLOPF|nr:hypothetical protein [Clostridium perfringens]EIF6297817.1 hypothetical protein [Clostridium perfringens]EIW6614802.1 hypothetical protein [Clostridium perfringens]EJT6480989.1 hypothetical protein [Clostridium perfringens]EJT6481248.1 hypothetical protein [Clostridium perfringens]EJT6531961.1 hypothetical protein [Clostridium perfringens]
MAFRRVKSITTGINKVTIIKVNMMLGRNGEEILLITVKNEYGAIQTFYILTSDTAKIDSMIKLRYNDVTDEDLNSQDYDIDEQDFVGLKMKINVGLKNGYLNILEIMEWQEESCFEEQNVIEDNCQEEF